MEDFQFCSMDFVYTTRQLLVETDDIKRKHLVELQRTLQFRMDVLRDYIRHLQEMELRQLPPPIAAGAL